MNWWKKSVKELNAKLRVSKIYFKVETGEQTKNIESKEQLQEGSAFARSNTSREKNVQYATARLPNGQEASSSVKYDLVGKIAAETGITRKAAVKILCGLDKAVFDQFADNPEEYIIRAAKIINEQKATAIIEH